ncbi:hypothetical protein PR202_ga31350 [Eleusine coracana subsp. coracana]|uniref:Homing endonuclease LAGLIDADG domain-containing protein n=1 Tax=Eleusine coracana subsp. coracana TaxID=191504 RepID=A0AAV5DSE3_ELECO|nr:hypothetical protein PR202_ga31350 [Eleusine coracana subsp. coracana]
MVRLRNARRCSKPWSSRGRVPAESTFHILVVAYLSVPGGRCLQEACTIYNQMIQMGGYKPRLNLHNSLFRALVSKTGGTAKHNLRQAEFIYHNIVTCNLAVHKEVYAGLIWLHSYQDVIDRDRIKALRDEMKRAGFEESSDVLVSVMRAFSKEGDVKETEATWHMLLQSGFEVPAQAYVCRMELYARTGEPMKSLEMFREMKGQNIPPNVASYHKIIEIMAKAREIETAEKLMDEFVASHMKHLMPAFLDLMYMYLDLNMHEELEQTFTKCIARCRPNRILYIIYLESLVRSGNIQRAEEIFGEMHKNGTIGTNAKSCNIMLRGYLSAEDYQKAESIYDIMCKKKYDVPADSMEKLQSGLLISKKVVKPKPVSMKLDEEQREILIDQFFLKGQPVLPKLVHRWLSPRVLAYWFMFGGFRLQSGDIVLKVLPRLIYDSFICASELLYPRNLLSGLGCTTSIPSDARSPCKSLVSKLVRIASLLSALASSLALLCSSRSAHCCSSISLSCSILCIACRHWPSKKSHSCACLSIISCRAASPGGAAGRRTPAVALEWRTFPRGQTARPVASASFWEELALAHAQGPGLAFSLLLVQLFG